MQNWKDLYLELCTVLDNVPEILWKDLWHNQVSFLETEHPFITPAVFLGFRTAQVDDNGLGVQSVNLQVDVYLYYETFADTYQGSANNVTAIIFLDIMNKINAVLHASEGVNYSQMRRTGFNPVDTGGSGNLYLITYSCWLRDYSAHKEPINGNPQPNGDVIVTDVYTDPVIGNDFSLS